MEGHQIWSNSNFSSCTICNTNFTWDEFISHQPCYTEVRPSTTIFCFRCFEYFGFKAFQQHLERCRQHWQIQETLSERVTQRMSSGATLSQEGMSTRDPISTHNTFTGMSSETHAIEDGFRQLHDPLMMDERLSQSLRQPSYIQPHANSFRLGRSPTVSPEQNHAAPVFDDDDDDDDAHTANANQTTVNQRLARSPSWSTHAESSQVDDLLFIREHQNQLSSNTQPHSKTRNSPLACLLSISLPAPSGTSQSSAIFLDSASHDAGQNIQQTLCPLSLEYDCNQNLRDWKAARDHACLEHLRDAQIQTLRPEDHCNDDTCHRPREDLDQRRRAGWHSHCKEQGCTETLDRHSDVENHILTHRIEQARYYCRLPRCHRSGRKHVHCTEPRCKDWFPSRNGMLIHKSKRHLPTVDGHEGLTTKKSQARNWCPLAREYDCHKSFGNNYQARVHACEEHLDIAEVVSWWEARCRDEECKSGLAASSDHAHCQVQGCSGSCFGKTEWDNHVRVHLIDDARPWCVCNIEGRSEKHLHCTTETCDYTAANPRALEVHTRVHNTRV